MIFISYKRNSQNNNLNIYQKDKTSINNAELIILIYVIIVSKLALISELNVHNYLNCSQLVYYIYYSISLLVKYILLF